MLNLKDLPDDIRDFKPSRIEYVEKLLYLLVSTYQRKHQESLAEEYDPKEKALDLDINCFSIDDAGNTYFTLPVFFTNFSLNKKGTEMLYKVENILLQFIRSNF